MKMGELLRFTATVEVEHEDLWLAVGVAYEGQLARIGTPGGLGGVFPCSERAGAGGGIGGDEVELGDVFVVPFGCLRIGLRFDGSEGEDGFCALLIEPNLADGFDL